MFNKTYAKLVLKMHFGFILFAFLLVGSLQFLIIWLFTSINYAPVIQAFIQQLPPQIKAVFAQEFLTRFSVKGAAAFGFNHPLVLILMGTASILIPSKHLAGEAESGTLEIILSYPVRRLQFLVTLWTTGTVILLFISVAGVVGSFSALILKKQLEVNLAIQLIKIDLNLWLLFMLIMSYTLMISASGKEASKTGLKGAGVTLIFYLHHFLGTIWTEIRVFDPLNIFNYFQPQQVMFQERSFLFHAIVLLFFTLMFYYISLKIFQKRDIAG